MTPVKKLARFLEELQAGREIQLNGRTWVWLDNYVARVGSDGTKYGINGLAIKGEMYRGGDRNNPVPHYIGATEMGLANLLDLMEDWEPEEVRTAYPALTSTDDSVMVKNVTCRELAAYRKWLDSYKYGTHMGYRCYPSRKKGCVTLLIDHSYRRLWCDHILPDLTKYWGSDRLIYEVEFEEEA